MTRRKWPVLALLYLVIVVYCLLDSYHTFQVLRLGIGESNPLVAGLMDAAGAWTALVWLKVFWLAVLGAGLVLWGKRAWK